MDAHSAKQAVRQGYDAVSRLYRDDFGDDGRYASWLHAIQQLLPTHAAVLDLGCGNGVPVTHTLVQHGHQVTGVDFSAVQIARARSLIPTATFVEADATGLTFPAQSFDAIICLYTLIHVPLDEQPLLLNRIADWLRPGGWLLTITGREAWTGSEQNWLGGRAPMWWSQADANTYRTWIAEARLHITSEQFVPEGSSGHQLFWACRPSSSPSNAKAPH